MYSNQLKEAFENLGVKAEISSALKNGKEMTCIVLGDGDVRPTIYPEMYKDLFSKGISADEIAVRIKKTIDEQKKPEIDSDFYNKIMDWNWVRDKIVLCLSPKINSEKILTIPFLDLDVYFRVVISEAKGEGRQSIIVTKQMIEKWNVAEGHLMDSGIKNADSNYHICDLNDTLEEMKKHCDFEVPEYVEDVKGVMYILTNSSGIEGAAGMILTNKLKELSEKLNDDLYIIPSSIHEIIIIGASGCDAIEITKMIKTVNKTVSQEEILSDHTYIYRREKGYVEIA